MKDLKDYLIEKCKGEISLRVAKELGEDSKEIKRKQLLVNRINGYIKKFDADLIEKNKKNVYLVTIGTELLYCPPCIVNGDSDDSSKTIDVLKEFKKEVEAW